MDTINGKPTVSGEPTVDASDWRTQLQPDSRQRIVSKIMDTLNRHLPFSGQEGLNELRKIAVRFEEKIFTAASSQSDYLRRISLKMLTMESKSRSSIQNTGNNNEAPDPVSQRMQNEVHSQGQSIPIPLHSNQSQARQQLLPQNVQNNMASAAVQSSAALQSAMPSVCGVAQNPVPNVVGQNSNMLHLSGISQNSLRQGIPSNNFATQQRQMLGRKLVLPQQQQQELLQQQQQRLYHQQLQHQLMKLKIQQGNLQRSLMQSNMLLQQQQHQQQHQQHQHQLRLLQAQQTLLQSSRQSVVHPSAAIQSTPLPSLQQNQQSSLQQSAQTMLQKHQQSVLRQQQQPQQSASAGIHKKQTPITQQSKMPQQTGHAIGDDWQEKIHEKTPFIPSTSTLLTPSPTPGNFEKPIYSAKQANDEQAGSGCLVPESVSVGMSAPPLLAESKSANDTCGNAFKTYFGKSNVAEQPHYPRVTMAKPMSLESLSTSVVTMVDEAAAAVGEDFASMRKHGLDARNCFTQTGLTGAEKVRFYMAIVALALIFWCIFFIYLQY